MLVNRKVYYLIKILLLITLVAISIKSFLDQDIHASSIVAVTLGIIGVKNYEIKMLKLNKYRGQKMTTFEELEKKFIDLSEEDLMLTEGGKKPWYQPVIDFGQGFLDSF